MSRKAAGSSVEGVRRATLANRQRVCQHPYVVPSWEKYWRKTQGTEKGYLNKFEPRGRGRRGKKFIYMAASRILFSASRVIATRESQSSK